MNLKSELVWYDSKELENTQAYATTDALDSILMTLTDTKIKREAYQMNKYELGQSHYDGLIPVFGNEPRNNSLRDTNAEKILQLRYRLEQLEKRLNCIEKRVSILIEAYSSKAHHSAHVGSHETNSVKLGECASFSALLLWTMWPIILLTMFNKLRVANLDKPAP